MHGATGRGGQTAPNRAVILLEGERGQGHRGKMHENSTVRVRLSEICDVARIYFILSQHPSSAVSPVMGLNSMTSTKLSDSHYHL